MTALWRGEVEMRWDGRRLMLGKLCVGWLGRGPDSWAWSTDADDVTSDDCDIPTEAEARAGLVAAVIKALEKAMPT